MGSSVEQHAGPQHDPLPDFTAAAISPYFCCTACRMLLLSMVSSSRPEGRQSVFAYANTPNNMRVRIYMSRGIYYEHERCPSDDTRGRVQGLCGPDQAQN